MQFQGLCRSLLVFKEAWLGIYAHSNKISNVDECNYRQIVAFFRYQKDGVDLVFSGPGKHKNNFKKV
jgi:hypothetical protein